MRAKLILAVASTLLSLLAVEIGIRLLIARNDLFADLPAARPMPPADRELALIDLFELDRDPRIVFRLRKGLRGRFHDTSIEINSLGHRGPESPLAKPAGTRRIVGLGDSVAFGWGVEATDSYLDIVAARLSDSAKPVEAVNLGVPGYNTIQEIEDFAAHGVALEPDVVILEIHENDLDLPIFLWSGAGGGIWGLRHWYTWEMLRGALGLGASEAGRSSELTPFAARIDTSRPSSDDQPPEGLQQLVGKQNFLAALDRLRDLSRERGFRVIVMPYFPSRSKEMPAAPIPYFTSPGSGNANFDFFLDESRKRGFEIADPEPAFERERRRRGLDPHGLWLSSVDSHPNVVGHRLIASTIEQVIRSRACGLNCAGIADGGTGRDGRADDTRPTPADAR